MIEYNSNINVVVGGLADQLKAFKENPGEVMKTVAMAILPELRHRVHVDGKDSDGNQIGIYSPEYMKVRTGNYKNSARFSRGNKKGEAKDSGVNTKTGIARPKYNRTPDTKVILSLTRQMENDESVFPTDNGYGIGFLNHHNYEKALWCEDTYNKPILSRLTQGELEFAQKTAQEFLPEYLKTL